MTGRKMQRRFGNVFVASVLLSACADADRPVQMGPDTYSIMAMASNSRGGSMGARTIAVRDAGQYCQSLERQLLVKNIENGTSGGYGTVNVTFRCLPGGDPELRRPDYQPTPNVIIENRKS